MIISHIVGKNQNQLHQSSNFIIQSKVHFPRSHISNFVKASQGVQAPPNLELVPMNFKLKQVDTSISLDSKGFAPGARLVWVLNALKMRNMLCMIVIYHQESGQSSLQISIIFLSLTRTQRKMFILTSFI